MAPTPLYQPNCSQAPTAIGCLAGPQGFFSLTAQRTVSGSTPSLTMGSGLLRTTMDLKGTVSRSDDSFFFDIPASVSVSIAGYPTLQSSFDGFSTVRTGTAAWTTSGQPVTLTIFELPTVLGGGLDYLQVSRMSGALTPFGNTGTAYSVSGVSSFNSGPPGITLPTSGSATYRGETRGDYIDAAGNTYSTASKIELVAYFGQSSIAGSATNFWGRDSAGVVAKLPDALDFNFNATIAVSTGPNGFQWQGFSGVASNAGMNGPIQGFFYGRQNGPPVEIGLTYGLSSNNGSQATLYGAGGLSTTPSDLTD